MNETVLDKICYPLKINRRISLLDQICKIWLGKKNGHRRKYTIAEVITNRINESEADDESAL